MNTEIINTLKAVQAARAEATAAFTSPDVSDADKRRMEKLVVHLSNLEGALINKVKEELVDALTEDSKPLQALIAKMDDSIAAIEKVAAAVQSAAAKVAAVIKIIGIAMAADIL